MAYYNCLPPFLSPTLGSSPSWYRPHHPPEKSSRSSLWWKEGSGTPADVTPWHHLSLSNSPPMPHSLPLLCFCFPFETKETPFPAYVWMAEHCWHLKDKKKQNRATVASKQMKRCLAALFIREMQIKYTMRYYPTPIMIDNIFFKNWQYQVQSN